MKIPIRNVVLDPFQQGASFFYRFTFTADTNLPDPNTWSTLRFSVKSKPPCTPVTITVEKGNMTITVTGSGPWGIILLVPLTNPATLLLPAQSCRVQLDFSDGTQSDSILTGTVIVLAADVPLTVP